MFLGRESEMMRWKEIQSGQFRELGAEAPVTQESSLWGIAQFYMATSTQDKKVKVCTFTPDCFFPGAVTDFVPAKSIALHHCRLHSGRC